MNENEVVQTDSEIISEFESLFGGDSSEASEEPETAVEVDEEGIEDDIEEATDGTEEEPEEDGGNSEGEEEGEEKSSQKKKIDSNIKKQREAFYKMRTQNKSYEKLFNRLGKLFGISESGNAEDVVARIEQALVHKEAEKSQVPVEIMQRLQELESIVNQKEIVDRESQVTNDLASLGSKFGLDQEDMEAFLLDLSDDGLNPLEVDNVDLEAEYIKRHFDEILENARNEGIQQESHRKDKVKEKAPGTLPGKKDKASVEGEINTVSDLDRFLDSL